MAQVLTQTTGTETRIIGVEPTVGEYEHEHAKKQNAADNKRAAKIEAAYQRERDLTAARAPSDEERRMNAVEGLRRTAKRMRRDGDGRADEAGKLADEAASMLQDYTAATVELQVPRPDILRDAAQPIARKLSKTIGGFDTDDEAVSCVLRTWPLTEARRQAVLNAERFGKLAKRRSTLGRAFWQVIERGARVAGFGNDQTSVQRLVDLGSI